jgi:hypothetical protein
MTVFAPGILLLLLTTGFVAKAEDGSFERSLTVSGPVDLDVTTDSGGITVRQGTSGSVRIHGIISANHGWFGSGDVSARIAELERNPPIEQQGNHLRVGYVHDKELLRNISIRFEIETPGETQLRARADSGGIHVAGVNGPVDCKTDSGGIQIDDVSAAVHASADSGHIAARNIKGSFVAHVESGGIDASGVAGSIDARTESGSIRLTQTTPATINAKADSGSVTVNLAHDAGYDVSAVTDSGSISVPEVTVHNKFSSHHIEGTIKGGGPLVKVAADSGSVTIN